MKPISLTVIWLWFMQLNSRFSIHMVYAVSTLPWTISAFSYFRSCPLSATIQYVTFNTTTNQYEVIQNLKQPPQLIRRDNNAQGSSSLRRNYPQFVVTPQHEHILATTNVFPVRQCTCPTTRQTYCPIVSIHPTDPVFNACAQSRDETTQTLVTCFVSPRLDLYLFARSTWPLIVFLLGTIVIFMAVTQSGKSVRKCITRQMLVTIGRRRWRQREVTQVHMDDSYHPSLNPITNPVTTPPIQTIGWFQRVFGTNESEVDRLVERELYVRHQMLESSYIAGIRMWLRIHGLEDESDVTAFIEHYRRTREVGSFRLDSSTTRNVAYVLKTKKYVSPTNKSPPQCKREFDFAELDLNDDEKGEPNKNDECNDPNFVDEGLLEDDMCTICYNVIEDGEKVGALTCNHNFHVECLTTWIQRRNVCPLCLSPNIARRKIEQTTAVVTYLRQDNNDNSNNNGDDSNSRPLHDIALSDEIVQLQEGFLNEISQRLESSSRERITNPQREDSISPRASSTRLVQNITGSRNPD